ncbi:hypothetical protein DL93DRAFT_2085156 [Clavulina sp. PMI_390]|nr:hypothetical protein DL93DRAFT_2085156 [Clavulina sp. PMI_390]
MDHSGYTLMTYTTPSEKELYDALSPELRRQVDARRLARENAGKGNAALTSDPDTAKPVWASDSQK